MGAARSGRGYGRSIVYDRRKPGSSHPAVPQPTIEERAERARRDRVEETQRPVSYHAARVAEAMGLPAQHFAHLWNDNEKIHYLLPHHRLIVEAFVTIHALLPVRGQLTIAHGIRKRLDPILAAQALGAPWEALTQMLREASKRR